MNRIDMIQAAREYAVSISGESLCTTPAELTDLLDYCQAEAEKIGETLGNVDVSDVDEFRGLVAREYGRIYGVEVQS